MVVSKLIPSAIVTVLLVLGAGYVAWQQFGSLQATPVQLIFSPAATSSPDTTAGWKTYRNEKYGFEFQYPTLGTKVKIDENELVPGERLRVKIRHWVEKRNGYSGSFAMGIYSNPEHFDLETWFSKSVDIDNLLKNSHKYEDRKLDNGVEILAITKRPMPPGYFEVGGPVSEYYFMFPSRAYAGALERGQDNDLDSLGYAGATGADKVTELESQVLSTFKFTK